MTTLRNLLITIAATIFIFIQSTNAMALSIQETHIKVQIRGAVKHPGIYTMFVGSRVAELVQHAGGPTPDADLKPLNLTRVLSDGDECEVLTRAQTATPAPNQMAAAPRPSMRSRGTGKRRRLSVHKPGKGPLVRESKDTGVRVHINSASAEQLQMLPGVGPGLAAAIVRQRQRQGAFHTVDDLREVPGFGERRLERVKPYIVID